ncbi:ribonuclease H-like domain-containing protein [Tanacetum coccineum]
MGCDENRMSINLAAAVFVAVSILKALKTEDLSRKLEVNYVKFQFRGGLLVPTGSTNEANTVNVQVSTVNSSVSTDSTLDSTANLSDATVYAFLNNQPNGSQLVHEDLEQIHEDDLKEMDLKWQLELLRYDKSKVECLNCHKMGHFARECKGPRNQESMPRNQDSSRRTVNVEDTLSKAMVAIDGAGFDWSFMAEEEVTTNMALMDFLDSEVYNDKTYSNTYLKSFEALKTQLDNLKVEFNKFEFNLATYKRGLASVEEQLVFYKKNEVMFYDQIVVLKIDASFKDSEIIALKSEIEKLKKEKECNQIKIDKFENASKCHVKIPKHNTTIFKQDFPTQNHQCILGTLCLTDLPEKPNF